MESRHKDFSLQVAGSTIKISSNFDSGNLENAQLIDGRVTLTPALDPMNAQYSLKQSSKTFFHFSLQASSEVDLPVVIRRMKILEYFASDEQFQQYYRACVGHKQKKGWSQVVEYEKVQLQNMRRVEVDGDYELHFSIKLEQQIYLAYHFPYPFEKNVQFLQELKQQIAAANVENEQKIYMTNELLVQSLEGRSVNLLTITSCSHMLEEEESRITKSIFPYFEMEGRPKKFAKPYVLFTCRVHSGETSASYALEGLIQFLISKDKRAEVLRENFVFLIIPVLNADGVYHGTYRMDTLGHNLNRFYNSAQSHKQPAVFAIQALANYYSSRIVFFMDLHSHPHPNKGSFIYGNCLTEIEDQTETQLYAKILSTESECFGYHWCNFSTSQMNSRDINELLTKDGSARVQLYKILNIPFAYTMEMGYHGCPPKKKLEEEVTFKDYRRSEKVFTIMDYKCHGKSIILSLLTLFQINTANGLKTQAGKYYQAMREQIFKDLIEKQQRFRLMDSFAFKKIKMIQELVYEQIYQPIFKKYASLEGALAKKNSPDKRNMIHTISENASVKKVRSLKKKELSLNTRQISKTIEASTAREKGILSFKSSIQSRERSDQRFQLIDSRQDNYSFAKMLNLDFNPFPTADKKKMYNVVGNRRASIKKTIISQIQFQSKNTPIAEGFDIETIDVNSQIELAEKAYKNTIKYQIVTTNRNKVLSNFNQNTYIQNEEEGIEYNDLNWQSNNERQSEEQRLILPKITTNDKAIPNFNIQVQFQKEYDKKYHLREHKDLTPAHYKVSLRNNGLRMRSLIKSNK